MRRLGRRAFNVTAALSLALCVATCMLKLIKFVPGYQITSYGKTDAGPRIVREHLLWANPYQVEGFIRVNADTTKPLQYSSFRLIPGVLLQWDRSNGIFFEFLFRFWFLLAVGVAMPLAWLISAVLRRLRDTRAARGPVCRSCGYDLRATPNRCPECGTVPNAPTISR